MNHEIATAKVEMPMTTVGQANSPKASAPCPKQNIRKIIFFRIPNMVFVVLKGGSKVPIGQDLGAL